MDREEFDKKLEDFLKETSKEIVSLTTDRLTDFLESVDRAPHDVLHASELIGETIKYAYGVVQTFNETLKDLPDETDTKH